MTGLFFIIDLTVESMDPKCTGICGALAINSPLLSKIAQEKSNRSLIVIDWDVFSNTNPICSAIDINKLLKEIQTSNIGGILGTKLKDTVKNVENSEDIKATIDREHLWIAQTPQIFRYGLLKKAMQFAFDNALMPTDEAQAIEHHGEKVKIIEGFAGNIKITESLDLKLAEMILSLRGVSCV